MTGYGRAAATVAETSVVVEIRTVNHRFLELKLRGLGMAGALEDRVAARVRGSFERGSVVVSVVARGADAGAPHLDRARAGQVFRELAALAAELGLAPPTLAELLAFPGVMATDATALLEDPAVLALVDAAVAEVCAMRAAEGAALARDLAARLERIAALTAELEGHAAAGAASLAERLKERVGRLLGQLDPHAALEPARLAQEVAHLADRADLTEELVRLRSHVAQARDLLEQPGAIGRRLEFLLQEIGRELNTVGAKAWSAAISARVVDAKSELEKLREQAQNVE